MTEQKWLSSEDPQAMLTAIVDRTLSGELRLTNRVSDRKLRLWVEACRAACNIHGDWRDLDEVSSMRVMLEYWSDNPPTPKSDRAALLREIVGNPFRPVTLPVVNYGGVYPPSGRVKIRSSKCPWLTRDVLSLAQVAYDERPGRKCSHCVGIGFGAYGDGGHTHGLRCVHCNGTGTINDGTLDPLTLQAVADAMEEAGAPPDEKCGRCTEPKALFRCTSCGRVVQPNEGPALQISRLCPSLACTGTLVSFRPPCQGCKGTGRVPHPVLAHLRSPGPHVRGCWALDLIRGVE